MGVASFGDYECAFDFFFFHEFVECVHGDDANGGLVEDAPDDGFFFVFGDVDYVCVCSFVFFFFDEFVFSEFYEDFCFAFFD